MTSLTALRPVLMGLALGALFNSCAKTVQPDSCGADANSESGSNANAENAACLADSMPPSSSPLPTLGSIVQSSQSLFIAATSVGEEKITITWAFEPGTVFDIEYGTASGVYSYSVAGATSPYVLPNLQPDVTYYIVIRSTSVTGEIVQSAELEAKTLPIDNPPGEFLLNEAVAQNGKVTLTWDSSLGASRYEVIRGTTTNLYPVILSTAATSPFVDRTNLQNGTTYFYMVTATNAKGKTAAISEVFVRFVANPGEFNLSSTALDGKVRLSWEPSSDATSYTVQRGTSSGSYPNTVSNSASSPFTDSNLTNGITYYYRVIGVNSAGTTNAKLESAATPIPGPGVLSSLAAAGGNSTVTLTWLPAMNAVRYEVRRKSGLGGYVTISQIASSPFIDTNLTNGLEYEYLVVPTNSVGTGQGSMATATPLPLPGSFTIASAAPGNSQITLVWGASANASTYTVQRGASSGVWDVVLSDSAASPYVDLGLTNGVTYYYMVTAVNSTGRVDASAVVAQIPQPAPGAFSISSASPGNAQATVTWSASSNVVSYTIMRGTTPGVWGTTLSTAASSPYTDSGLSNSTVYYYMVSAVNPSGTTSATAQASVTPLAPPGSFAISSALPGNTMVTVSWPSSSGAVSYTLKRGLSPGSHPVSLSTSAVSPFQDSGLTNGTTYYYMVTAIGPTGSTNAATEASATPGPAPGSFSILSVRPRNGEVSVSWTGSTAATAYRLKRGSASGVWANILSENASSPFLDSGLSNGTQYFYMVTAVNAVASVDANAEASGTPFATATPTLALFSPASSPNSAPRPTFRITGGTFAFGDTLSLHDTSNCTGAAIATSGVLANSITQLDLSPSSNITANTDLSFSAKNQSAGGITTCSGQNIVYRYDDTGPSVTITRAAGQAYQIANGGSIANFTATFDREIIGFEEADITPEVGSLNLSFSIIPTANSKVFTLRAISASEVGRIQPKIAAGTLTDSFANYNSLAVNTSAVVYTGQWRSGGGPGLPRSITQHNTTILNDGRVFLAGGLTGGVAIATATIYSPSTNTFQDSANTMPTARRNTTSTLLSDGRVLVAHGSGDANVLRNTVTIYNPATNLFDAGTTLSSPRISHTASLLPNGKVLIAGGTSNFTTASINSADIFDPTNATYTTVAINGSRHGHSAIVLSNGKVLLVGGSSGTTALATGVIFNPADSSITAVTNTMAAGRTGFTATLLTNGKVLIAGGSNGTNQNSADIYNPATNSFTPINNIGGARGSHTATLMNDGRVILIGGRDASSNYLDSAAIYDPTSNSLTYISSIAGARSIHSSILLPDGRVLAVAGMGVGNSILNSAAFFDPLTNAFISTLNNLSSTRYQTSATTMPGGKAGIFGGYNGSYLATSDIFE